MSDLHGFDPGPLPRPLPAAEVRRRGDRLRRRRRLATTAATLAAVAVIAAPVAWYAGGLSNQASPPLLTDPVETPTPTPTPVVPTLAVEHLISTEDTEFGGAGEWSGGEPASEETHLLHPCQRSPFSALGAVGYVEAGWHVESTFTLTQTIAEFGSSAEARDARDRFVDWLLDCEQPHDGEAPEPLDYTAGELVEVPLPVDGAAHLVDSTYRLDITEGGESFSRHRMVTGLAVVGSRLTVLTSTMPEADYRWDPTQDMALMLGRAAEQLGGEAASHPWVTAIPGDFPIDLGLFTDGDGHVSGPSQDAEGADIRVVCGAGRYLDRWLDRVAVRSSGPEYADARELLTFPDARTAQAELGDLRRAIEDCPTEGASPARVWTVHEGAQVGEETLIVSRTLDVGTGENVFLLTRFDNALLVLDAGGEWTLDSTVDAGIDDLVALADAFAPHLCQFLVDGC
ncbi:hypothetical protein [Nocardioides limicola]|uniref:hypothetical protein n=1 Tax=Nocardioides limicola TaxID=2803368 RepID=UPI00193B7620|nr:hypothetical protein [Nocardioides sp. DJM-14]